MDRKRFIYLIIFILISIGLGYLLYRVFFYKPTPTVVAPPGAVTPPTPTPTQFPEAGVGVPTGEVREPGVLPTAGRAIQTPGAQRQAPIKTLTKDPVTGARADKSGAVNYYNQLDGKFYRLDSSGRPRLLSDTIFYGVEKVTWSPTQTASILEYPDGSNIYYDFDTKRQVTIPKHWEEFSFAPQGDRITSKSIGFSPENRWIVSANPDGTDVKIVAALGNKADKVTLDWSPNNQIVGYSLTGEALGADREEVLFVGLNGENFKSTIVEGRGIRSRWSPDGAKLLYSVYSAQNDYKPQLWVVNADGGSIGTGRKLLSLETWADKCSFANPKTVYCGVPETLQTGVGFAPDLANGTRDRLVKIDVETGLRSDLPFPDYHVVDTITLSTDGTKLYFTDKQLPGVFEVNL